MRIENDPKLDFRDVLIRPKRSTLGSRAHVDVERSFHFPHTGTEWKGFPLIAANMDVVGTMAMARALLKHGAMVALHKHYDAEALIAFFREPGSANAFYSLGTTEADHDKLKAVHAQSPISKICLDVANGYTEKFVDTVKATDSAFEPEFAAMASERMEVVRGAIGDLSERERDVLALVHVHELQGAEIGRMLGVSESRVSQILAGVRTKLRQQLELYDANVAA